MHTNLSVQCVICYKFTFLSELTSLVQLPGFKNRSNYINLTVLQIPFSNTSTLSTISWTSPLGGFRQLKPHIFPTDLLSPNQLSSLISWCYTLYQASRREEQVFPDFLSLI